MVELDLSSVSVHDKVERFERLIELFNLQNTKDLLDLGSYNTIDVIHRSLLLSVYCVVTKATKWPRSEKKWKAFGFSRISELIEFFKHNPSSTLSLLQILFYYQRTGTLPCRTSEKSIDFPKLSELSEVTINLIKSGKITTLPDVFFSFVVLVKTYTQDTTISLTLFSENLNQYKSMYFNQLINNV